MVKILILCLVYLFLTENLVPNVFLELFFVLQLLTSRTPAVTEEEDKDLSMRKLGERWRFFNMTCNQYGWSFVIFFLSAQMYLFKCNG